MAPKPVPTGQPVLAGSALALLALVLAPPLRASAQTSPYYNGPSQQEQQIYNDGPSGGSRSGGSILDAANPIDLMNRIRRATAMDDATTPVDAIDQALRALEVQSAPTSPAAPLVKAP
jgi:hypothetical protein